MTSWVLTLASAIPAEDGSTGSSRKGYLQYKQSGSFHKVWTRNFMSVSETAVAIYTVCRVLTCCAHRTEERRPDPPLVLPLSAAHRPSCQGRRVGPDAPV